MSFYNVVLDVLKQDERFFTDDGQLLRNAVYEAAMQMDARLIKALYDNEGTRKHFFTDIDGIAVFDKIGFGMKFINDDSLVELLMNKILSIQGKESPMLKSLKKQLSQTDTAIENMLNAIEQGIITKSTKSDLMNLKAQKKI